MNSLYELVKDIRTFFWFISKGPSFYPTLLEHLLRVFKKKHDSDTHAFIEKDWCNKKSISVPELFEKLSFDYNGNSALSDEYILKVQKVIDSSNANFGGKGHINLLYNLSESISAVNCIETGVAYGWSSESLLRSITKRDGKLISIDMPMIGQTDYHLIGCAVSKDMTSSWKLIKEPDRNGLIKAIEQFNNKLDLIHYDSDKTYYGRIWSQPIIYDALRKGGLFISDDIECNSAFREFATSNNLDYFVVKFEGRYVGYKEVSMSNTFSV